MYKTMPLGRTYMYDSRYCLSKGYRYMQETMPLGRTYILNSKNRLSKGYCCMCETMPLSRTYMYNFGNRFLKGCCYMCETMPLGRTHMFNSKNHLSMSFTFVILVALASHCILTGLPIQFDSDQSTEGDGKGRDHTK